MTILKKAIIFVSALLAALLLGGCATSCAHGFLHAPPTTSQTASDASDPSSPDSSAPQPSTADYKTVIEASRDEELNTITTFDVITSPSDDMYNHIFNEAMGFNDDSYQLYAVSASAIITQAYGVAIILPKPGQREAVMDSVNLFVKTQQDQMENYLADQYEIAKAAIVKTAPTGEILLAMCKDADKVMAAMEEGLAAG